MGKYAEKEFTMEQTETGMKDSIGKIREMEEEYTTGRMETGWKGSTRTGNCMAMQ